MFTVIILNYRGYDRTIALLRNLNSLAGDFNIVIVDNSEDIEKHKDFAKKLRSICTRSIFVVESPSNGGYAKGNNLGIRRAKEWGVLNKYVIVLNNDIEIQNQQFINELEKLVFKYSNHYAFGPKVIHKNSGRLQGPYARKYILTILFNALFPLLGVLRVLGFNGLKREKRFVFRLMGCALIFRSREFLSMGLFDENTFLGAEEDILGEKLRNKGTSFVYLPELEIIHDHGDSTRKEDSFFIRKAFRTSMLYYFKSYRNAGSISLLVLDYSLRLIDYWRRLL